jgi:hypothetical protein
MSRAEAFSEREVEICNMAKLVEDGKAYWVAGGGTPLYSVLLAKRLYTPGAVRDRGRRYRARSHAAVRARWMTMVASRPPITRLAWGT